LYGEGEKAGIRLQEEIMKNSEDQISLSENLAMLLRTFEGFWLIRPQNIETAQRSPYPENSSFRLAAPFALQKLDFTLLPIEAS
jgi:hypothetical protein